MNGDGTVAIVEDDPELREQLRWAIGEKFTVHGAGDAVDGLRLLDLAPDVFLIDLCLPPSLRPREGLELLRAIRQRSPEMTVVVMTGESDRQYAREAIELGAFDFFHKPFDRDELMLVLGRATERRRLIEENRLLRDEVLGQKRFDQLLGAAPAMKDLFEKIRKVSPTDATVLIEGESGTGKELVAHAIHRSSLRSRQPFIAVNGAALQDTLAESELFGHEKGAFTGAVGSRPGKFELAQHGTLFLDEIATLSPAVQAKMLRALEARQIERVGGTRTIQVDLRLISATNEKLTERVAAGSFREDLFYRINSVTLSVPPLRERQEDLPLLAEFFAVRYAARLGKPQKAFHPDTIACFRGYPWRGNVRELEHLVEMLTLFVDQDTILPEHLPPAFRSSSRNGEDPLMSLPFTDAVAGFERRLIERALDEADGVKAKAARLLGLDSNQMKYLCRKHQI